MALKIIAVIECDDCDAIYDHPNSQVFMAIDQATLMGWMCYGVHSHLCPDCGSRNKTLAHPYSPFTLGRLLNDQYLYASFKYWAIAPLVRNGFSDQNLEKRVKEVNKRLSQYQDKYGATNHFVESITIGHLLFWKRILESSPFDKMVAFVEYNKTAEEYGLDPSIMEIVDRVIFENAHSTEVKLSRDKTYDLVVKEIAQDLGEREGDNPDFKFPTQQLVQKRIEETRPSQSNDLAESE